MIANLYVGNRLWDSIEIKELRPTVNLAVSEPIIENVPSDDGSKVVDMHVMVFEFMNVDRGRDISRYRFKGVSH